MSLVVTWRAFEGRGLHMVVIRVKDVARSAVSAAQLCQSTHSDLGASAELRKTGEHERQ